jgi:hypothetical protein
MRPGLFRSCQRAVSRQNFCPGNSHGTRFAGNTTRAGILAMMVGMQGTRCRFVAGTLAICLSAAMGQNRDWNCPPTPGLPESGSPWEKWFVGSIGSVGARLGEAT